MDEQILAMIGLIAQKQHHPNRGVTPKVVDDKIAAAIAAIPAVSGNNFKRLARTSVASGSAANSDPIDCSTLPSTATDVEFLVVAKVGAINDQITIYFTDADSIAVYGADTATVQGSADVGETNLYVRVKLPSNFKVPKSVTGTFGDASYTIYTTGYYYA